MTDGSEQDDLALPGLGDLESRPRLAIGQLVTIQTIWGKEEGIVTGVNKSPHGFPLVTVDTASADRITLDVARVKPAESEDPQVQSSTSVSDHVS